MKHFIGGCILADVIGMFIEHFNRTSPVNPGLSMMLIIILSGISAWLLLP
jgi:F0F1-type ATP synthase assembly protein I